MYVNVLTKLKKQGRISGLPKCSPVNGNEHQNYRLHKKRSRRGAWLASLNSPRTRPAESGHARAPVQKMRFAGRHTLFLAHPRLASYSERSLRATATRGGQPDRAHKGAGKRRRSAFSGATCLTVLDLLLHGLLLQTNVRIFASFGSPPIRVSLINPHYRTTRGRRQLLS